jgi:hypothetical protein
LWLGGLLVAAKYGENPSISNEMAAFIVNFNMAAAAILFFEFYFLFSSS